VALGLWHTLLATSARSAFFFDEPALPFPETFVLVQSCQKISLTSKLPASMCIELSAGPLPFLASLIMAQWGQSSDLVSHIQFLRARSKQYRNIRRRFCLLPTQLVSARSRTSSTTSNGCSSAFFSPHTTIQWACCPERPKAMNTSATASLALAHA